jgi:predicted phage terminase large subunit-like protein
MNVTLTADLIESFAGTFVSPRYDSPKPTPPFHRAAWALYASQVPAALVVAPRDHAKSTGLTTDYVLAESLFRTADYIIIIGSTEEGAAEQLGNIVEELTENDDIIREFGVAKFLRTAATDVICEMRDGHRFRIIAKGAEQRIRGRLWKGKRPNLLVCDDMEDDEQVENADRRAKFRRWFFRAAKQALGKQGRIRVHGTILHEDSLLNRLRKNKTWVHQFYKAHESFDDFSNILWPERWTEEQLRARRQEFIEDGDAAGYSQEFLNDPQDNSIAYLKAGDFLPMSEEDHAAEKVFCAAADFAVSKKDKANRTAFVVGGKSVNNNLNVVDVRVDRWDAAEWIEEMFSIQLRWNPEVFWVEDGVIWKAVRSMVYREMQLRDIRINIEARPSITDKATRGRSLQRRMRAGQCRFDKAAEWYPGYEQEMRKFTGTSDALLDDQFDATALLSLGFDDFSHVEEEDFYDEEDWEMERGFWNRPKRQGQSGRSRVTGY